jgi:hypothetical protein
MLSAITTWYILFSLFPETTPFDTIHSFFIFQFSGVRVFIVATRHVPCRYLPERIRRLGILHFEEETGRRPLHSRLENAHVRKIGNLRAGERANLNVNGSSRHLLSVVYHTET